MSVVATFSNVLLNFNLRLYIAMGELIELFYQRDLVTFLGEIVHNNLQPQS